ncbi:MAG: hypothetical protein JWO22_1597 [Frankiales bacterium]|nr:hypothetical protein [Frankiales bacterium]
MTVQPGTVRGARVGAPREAAQPAGTGEVA